MGDVALGFSDAIRNSPYANWAEFQRQKRKDAQEEIRAGLEAEAIRHGMKSKDEELALNRRRTSLEEESTRHGMKYRGLEYETRKNESDANVDLLRKNLEKAKIDLQRATDDLAADPQNRELQRRKTNAEIDHAEALATHTRELTAASKAGREKKPPTSAELAAEEAAEQTRTGLLTKSMLDRIAPYNPEFGRAASIYEEAANARTAAFGVLTTTDSEGEEVALSIQQRVAAGNAAYNKYLKDNEKILQPAANLRSKIGQYRKGGLTIDMVNSASEEQVQAVLRDIGIVAAPRGGEGGEGGATQPPPKIGRSTSGTTSSRATTKYPFNQDGTNPLWGSIGNAGVYLGRGLGDTARHTVGGLGVLSDMLLGQYGSPTGSTRMIRDPRGYDQDIALNKHNERVTELLPTLMLRSEALDKSYGMQAEALQNQMQTATGANLELLQKAFQQHALKYEEEKRALERNYYDALYPRSMNLGGR